MRTIKRDKSKTMEQDLVDTFKREESYSYLKSEPLQRNSTVEEHLRDLKASDDYIPQSLKRKGK